MVLPTIIKIGMNTYDTDFHLHHLCSPSVHHSSGICHNIPGQNHTTTGPVDNNLYERIFEFITWSGFLPYDSGSNIQLSWRII